MTSDADRAGQTPETALAHLLRLLRQSAEFDGAMLASSRRAIEETRRLLARVAKEHPDIQ